MKTLFYSTKGFERPVLETANKEELPLSFIERPLSIHTTAKASGFDAISIFAGDDASAPVLEQLAQEGIFFISVRATGTDNIDLDKAAELGISVANVPGYSPHAIAEHAVALILSLNRHIVKADTQVHRHDFRVDDLVGFDLFGKTIGVIGTGQIGSAFALIMHGFGCKILAYDPQQNEDLTKDAIVEYTDLNSLYANSDIISIHCPLNASTRYLVDRVSIGKFKKGMMLINTSRGGCVNTADLITALKSGHISAYGADVYEHEKGIFFYDKMSKPLQDDLLEKLLSLHSVLITPHQAFATHEALRNIAETTFYNLGCWNKRVNSKNELTPSFAPLTTP